MLNREKYAEEILNIACDGCNIALINGKLEKCRGVCNKCDFCDNDIRNAGRCREKAKEWANSQYVDWSEVPVDTPILVRDSELFAWSKEHFAKYENGMVYTWANGATSWSGEIVSSWMYAKLAESEEVNRILAEEEKTGGWIPVTERLPEDDKYIMISFKNFTLPDIGRYEADKDGNGAFYPGDDEKSYVEYDLFVNAWMPLPEPYRESEESHD